MKDIMTTLADIFIPVQSFVIYYKVTDDTDVYVESYDIDQRGTPMNPHPLTNDEAIRLAKTLASSKDLHSGFLHCNGILPFNILRIDSTMGGYAIWFTPAMQTNLFFKNTMGIPCGKAYIPPLIWKAYRSRLQVFAVHEAGRPHEDTRLYHAPFFNTSDNGEVCMGTVDITTEHECDLQKFIGSWQHFFFNSYFSHLTGSNPVSCNIVQLWQDQIHTQRPFPNDVLIPNKKTLKDLY